MQAYADTGGSCQILYVRWTEDYWTEYQTRGWLTASELFSLNDVMLASIHVGNSWHVEAQQLEHRDVTENKTSPKSYSQKIGTVNSFLLWHVLGFWKFC